MLSQLTEVVDGLYDLVRKKIPLKGSVIILVGNGIDQVNNILYHDTLEKRALDKGITDPDELETFKWEHYEFARYYTANSLPSLAHCIIHRLVQDGLCQHVITTNYDMFFDEIWRRNPSTGIARNPLRHPDEWHHEEYYSTKTGTAGYWKIHGSLSHVVFQDSSSESNHAILKLPKFAISVNHSNIASLYNLPNQAPCLGYEKAFFPASGFAKHADLSPRFQPYIDWTFRNNRDLFAREISSATDILRHATKDDVLFLVGFSGYYNDSDESDTWNEELVPTIKDYIKRHPDNVFMAVHEEQAKAMKKKPGKYSLMEHLRKNNRCVQYNFAGEFMHDLMALCDSFPLDEVLLEYEYWKNNFYLDLKETEHGTGTK